MRYTDLGRRCARSPRTGRWRRRSASTDERIALLLVRRVRRARRHRRRVPRAVVHATPAQIYAWVGVVFAAVMLGGLGSPLGPLAAGIIIGVSEALTMAFAVAVVGADRLVHAADRASCSSGRGSLKPDRAARRHRRRGRGARGRCRSLRLPAFYESFLYLVLHWIVLATSWNILSGYSGYFSFGHGAFFGAGVYTTAVLAGKFDVPFLWTLPAAALVPALLGVALGAVVFRVRRVRGELFALADAGGDVRARDDRAQHADRRRAGRLSVRRRRAALAPTPSRRVLPARAGAGDRDAGDRLRDHGAARARPVRDPRRRGCRRGDGRADLPLQARRVRRSRARSRALREASTRCSSRT